MNRRNFLKAMAVTAAGIAVPELIVPEKRFWALDRTMVSPEENAQMMWWNMGIQVDHRFQSCTVDVSPELRAEWDRLYLLAKRDLERALLCGEYNTPMGEFFKNHPAGWIT